MAWKIRELVRRIERRPDDRWLRSAADAVFLPDGNLGVLHRSSSQWAREPWSLPDSELLVYSPDGAPLRQVDIGRAHNRLESSGRWLLSPDGFGGAELLLFDLVSERAYRTELGLETDSGGVLIGLSAEGHRVLAFDPKANLVHRWELPE